MLYRMCLDNCCGYCKTEPEVITVTEKQTSYYVGGGASLVDVSVRVCKNKYDSCEKFLRNSEVNPFRPELEKKK